MVRCGFTRLGVGGLARCGTIKHRYRASTYTKRLWILMEAQEGGVGGEHLYKHREESREGRSHNLGFLRAEIN